MARPKRSGTKNGKKSSNRCWIKGDQETEKPFKKNRNYRRETREFEGHNQTGDARKKQAKGKGKGPVVNEQNPPRKGQRADGRKKVKRFKGGAAVLCHQDSM